MLPVGAGGPTAKTVHLHSWQVGAGYWQEASVLLHVVSPQSHLSVLRVVVGFLRAGDVEVKAETAKPVVTQPRNSHIVTVTSTVSYWPPRDLVSKGTGQSMYTRRWGKRWAMMENDCHMQKLGLKSRAVPWESPCTSPCCPSQAASLKLGSF